MVVCDRHTCGVARKIAPGYEIRAWLLGLEMTQGLMITDFQPTSDAFVTSESNFPILHLVCIIAHYIISTRLPGQLWHMAGPKSSELFGYRSLAYI